MALERERVFNTKDKFIKLKSLWSRKNNNNFYGYQLGFSLKMVDELRPCLESNHCNKTMYSFRQGFLCWILFVIYVNVWLYKCASLSLSLKETPPKSSSSLSMGTRTIARGGSKHPNREVNYLALQLFGQLDGSVRRRSAPAGVRERSSGHMFLLYKLLQIYNITISTEIFLFYNSYGNLCF